MSQKKSSNTSSSTPSGATKKTASAPKVIIFAGVQAIAIILVTAALLGWWRNETVHIRFGGTTIQAELADTDAERAKGLSSKPYLRDNHGMLFVFPYDATWEIWMKDMHVAIDIVWLDAEKTVVGVEHTVHPQSYPDTFAPSTEARYVVELAAGVARTAHIEPGMVAEFDVPTTAK